MEPRKLFVNFFLTAGQCWALMFTKFTKSFFSSQKVARKSGPGSHFKFIHTFQGSDPESVHTSFASFAHRPSAYRMPGPARPSIRPTCLVKHVRSVLFTASGPGWASGEARGVRRPYVCRLAQSDAARYKRGPHPE